MEHDAFLTLQLVNKQFIDLRIPKLYQRITQLEQENTALKLKLFWKNHKYVKLRSVLREANMKIPTLLCNCTQCCQYNNTWNGYEDPYRTCALNRWLEAKLHACELTHTDVSESDMFTWSRSGIKHKVYNKDTLFVEVRNYIGPNYISKFIYGPKILQAKSVDDPELKKLELLFQTIDQEIEENEYIPQPPHPQ